MHRMAITILCVLALTVVVAGCGPRSQTGRRMGQTPGTTGRTETPTGMESSRPALLTEIHDDHVQVSEMLQDLGRTTDPEEGRRQLSELSAALLPHMKAEEAVFYPAVRKAGGNADTEVAAAMKEHEAARQMLTQLEGMQVGGNDWSTRVQELTNAITAHVQREEGSIFPIAEQAYPGDRMDTLKTSFDQIKQAAMKGTAAQPALEAARGTSEEMAKPAGAAANKMREMAKPARSNYNNANSSSRY